VDATCGIANRTHDVQPLGCGDCRQIFDRSLVAAVGLRLIKETIQQQPYFCPTSRRLNQQLQARVGVGDRIAVNIAPVLLL
jgi:hypothetical protein